MLYITCGNKFTGSLFLKPSFLDETWLHAVGGNSCSTCMSNKLNNICDYMSDKEADMTLQ